MFLKIIALIIIILFSRMFIGFMVKKTVDRFSLLIKALFVTPGISFFMASIFAVKNGVINIPIMFLCWIFIIGGYVVFVSSRMK